MAQFIRRASGSQGFSRVGMDGAFMPHPDGDGELNKRRRLLVERSGRLRRMTESGIGGPNVIVFLDKSLKTFGRFAHGSMV